MSKQRHRRRSQGGTTPETRPQTGPGVAQFSVSEVAQFSMSVDTVPCKGLLRHIASTAERRERMDAFMWQVQRSLLLTVQKRYGKKALRRTGA